MVSITCEIPTPETLTTGEGGVYTFSDVEMPEGRVFLVSADYASGLYGSEIAI